MYNRKSMTEKELAPCPGGTGHIPKLMNVAGHFWVECKDCQRESYVVNSATDAASGWASDVGRPGRSNLLRSLRDQAGAQA